MRAYYSDRFVLPLPDGHRFPMKKYRWLRERVAREMPDIELVEPDAATDGELALAHTPAYIERVATGALSPAETREIGFPWSPEMVERSRRSAGATIGACRTALEEGVSVNLAGGTHHAYADKGSGFCVFNDAAIAARRIQAEQVKRGAAFRVAVIDLDVHQGNGTASILANDPTVFTLSLHGEKNFPFRKETSDLDVGLPDGTGDEEYLTALDHALNTLFARFTPSLVIYLAGADVHEGDRLGKLKLTKAGIEQRDRIVLTRTVGCAIPVAIAMAGGYGRDLEQTVDVQFSTVRIAREYARAWSASRKASAA
ncbi:MAG TPA: histone deacetylase [Burkholderiaceae bacterium]|nr:histone deacetylase [Burkholderiaceae bacterium]